MKKKVLITGSSKGIGESIAKTLAFCNYEVFLTGRNEQRLSSLAKEIGASGFLAIDLQEDGACEKLISAAQEFDILINNAGDYVWAPAEKTPSYAVKKLLKLNLEVPYTLCSLATKQMKAKGWGRIINIGSISGAVGEANASLYSASKAGLIGMSKALALELAEYGITVNIINPGWVKTDMTQEINEQEELECVPQKRFIEPQEIAKAVEYLCSDSAKGITGQSINLCAGLSLG